MAALKTVLGGTMHARTTGVRLTTEHARCGSAAHRRGGAVGAYGASDSRPATGGPDANRSQTGWMVRCAGHRTGPIN